MFSKLFLGVLIAWLSSGCATIFTGTRDNVTISSVPAGAKVTIDELEYGQTPVTIPMKRDAMRQSGKRVTLRKDGYQDKAFNLQKEFNYVSICNVGYLPFWAIDFISGALFVYDPVSYAITLEPKAATPVVIPPGATPLAYTPKVGDPVDLLILSWGPASQTGVIEGKNKLMYQRIEGTYLITVTPDQKIADIQVIQR